ncbi:hypothetical protein [Levilactobacillus bambusae]|uniref:dUTPase n=1 Tax=Levilactobacillus bambusae TaxID=2024736 RepID=A0A2V1N333_9LACO|nr:hypothetical protein [Levilactobacillus bambusae]PWG00938.1 hypothetical protein DCM90_01820 [Levilactobacillus bambusae]
MLDLAKMLQQTIIADNAFKANHQVTLSGQQGKERAYVQCDTALANLRSTADLSNEANVSEISQRYAAGLIGFLLIAAKQTWSQVIVMKPDDYQRLLKTKVSSDWDEHYLITKRLIFNSYFEHRQDDFRHAWRLYLKFGLVDLKLSETAIREAFEAQMEQVNQG